MGVDFYTCAVCERNFPDCGNYYNCELCDNHFCCDECADPKPIEVDEVFENDESEDSYEEEFSCCLCRKEAATNDQLLNCLLEHFNITYDDAMKIYRQETLDSKEKPESKLLKWQVRWDSGGCAGSDTLGEVEAVDEASAWAKVKEKYYTGDMYNDDNLHIRIVK